MLSNPARVPFRRAPDRDETTARAFHRRLPGYVPSRLVEVPALASELGMSRVVVKDESARFGLPSYKILGASWAAYRALVERLGAEPGWSSLADLRHCLQPLGELTLVTATDGNHGRAVARVAGWLGYRARILVPAGTAPARIRAIAGEGAEVEVVSGSYDDAVDITAGLTGGSILVLSDTSWPGYADIPRWVMEGYSTIWSEADEQLGGVTPDVVVVQMGVGTLAASVVHAYAARAGVAVTENTAAPCGLRSAAAGRPVTVPGPHQSIMAGLNCGRVSPDVWPDLAGGVDVFLTVTDSDAEQAVRDLTTAGIAAGETGAAGFAGLRALAARTDSHQLVLARSTALVICTEGPTDPDAYARITAKA